MAGIECGGFTFYNDFDSANLARVEFVPPPETPVTASSNPSKSVVPEVPDAEFNIWTKPDCAGTEFQNGNRTWFYFGIKGNAPSQLVKLNMVDLNKQMKMYSQGMAPVYKVSPGKSTWERIRDKPMYHVTDGIFVVTFKHRLPENLQCVTYFAFTYPFSYTDLQKMMVNIDAKYLNTAPTCMDDIYYCRECVCLSLEGRRIELLTISSYHGITAEREVRLKSLFPEQNIMRPFKFVGKKVIFISARVHPGETPSSFVLNGLLSLLLCREDQIGIALRRQYVFKVIPFLNPDGVARGHYRTDTRGVNLNRVYLNPILSLHPSVYAARALIRYYHFGFEKEDIVFPSKCERCQAQTDGSLSDDENMQNENISKQVSHMSLEEKSSSRLWCIKCRKCGAELEPISGDVDATGEQQQGDVNSNESGLFLYMDFHGHAAKKGIFMYGNHFDDADQSVDCMLLPKLMSLNNHNFHFTACNFTERNMYLRDKRDGMSREGSGRVAVLKLTGLTRSYTLECNYNTGRLVNVIPPTIKESHSKLHVVNVPPKYTPHVFEEVGRALGPSILDLTSQNPLTRLPNSEFHSLNGLRDWLRCNCIGDLWEPPNPVGPKVSRSLKARRSSSSHHSQGKSTKGVIIKSRPPTVKTVSKKQGGGGKSRPASVPIDRKENMLCVSSQPSCSYQPAANHRNKTAPKLNKGLTAKPKFKKDGGTKGDKQKNPGKLKQKALNVTNAQKLHAESGSKLKALKDAPSKEESERVQLREICLVKSNVGKTLIAKYNMGNKDDKYDENLIVSWEGCTGPQVFTHKPIIAAVPYAPIRATSEPGTSKQGSFRVHNFSKSSKFKPKKHTLRRLASASESPCKADKVKKKKKLKTK